MKMRSNKTILDATSGVALSTKSIKEDPLSTDAPAHYPRMSEAVLQSNPVEISVNPPTTDTPHSRIKLEHPHTEGGLHNHPHTEEVLLDFVADPTTAVVAGAVIIDTADVSDNDRVVAKMDLDVEVRQTPPSSQMPLPIPIESPVPVSSSSSSSTNNVEEPPEFYISQLTDCDVETCIVVGEEEMADVPTTTEEVVVQSACSESTENSFYVTTVVEEQRSSDMATSDHDYIHHGC